MLRTLLTVGYPGVRAIIEDDAVHQTLHDRAAFVLLRRHETIYRRRHIDIERAGEERTPCAQDEFRRYERPFYRSKRRGFGDKTLRAGRRVLALGQTVDAVVEETDVQVHVPSYLMNEMVSADSQAVAVTAHLPNSQFGMRCLDARSDCATATMDCIKTIRIEVVRHTAGTTDTGDNSHLMGRDTYLRHGFLQRHTDRVIAATRAETYILIGFKLRCFHSVIVLLVQLVLLVYLVVFNKINDSFHRKGLSLNLVILLYLQVGELCAEICCELTCIEFTNDNSLILTQHFAGILRQRTDIVEMRQVAA